MPDEELTHQDEQPTGSQVEVGDEAVAEPSDIEKLKEHVDVAVEDIGTLRKKLTITIKREAIDERLEKQYADLSREAVVPGFRKGRAPRRLLEKRFGGEVSETITSDLLGNGYLAAIEKADLKVIGDPLIWCKPKKPVKAESGEPEAPTEKLMGVREAFENLELPREGALTFTCEVEVRPEFELPALEGIPIRKPKVGISEADVQEAVDRFLLSRGRFEVMEDAAVEKDDVLLAALTVTVDGNVIKQAEDAFVAARPQVIEGVTLMQLGETLVGARVGDTRTICGTVPEDSDKAELRGKTAEFAFAIKQIQRFRKAELTDELVRSVGFDSAEEFRQYVRSDLEARLADAVRRGMRSQVYKYLLDHTKIDLPDRLSQRQADRVVVRRMLDLYREGVPEAEVERRMDALKTTARDEAATDLKLGFIMEKIAEDVQPEVTEDEVNGQIAAIAQRQNRRFDRVRDELIKSGGLESLYIALRDEKIVDHLMAQANIIETDGPEASAPAAAEAPAPEAAAEKTGSEDAT